MMLFSRATTKMHVFGSEASFTSENNWKIRLFPEPVGKIAITSRPKIRAFWVSIFGKRAKKIPAGLQPSSTCQWFRFLTLCCQRFTHQPIVFLHCEANAYFIGSGCVGSLFFSSWAADLISCVTAQYSLKRMANWRKMRDCSQSKKMLQRRLFVTHLSKGNYFVSFTVVILYLFVSFSKFITHHELKICALNMIIIIICY